MTDARKALESARNALTRLAKGRYYRFSGSMGDPRDDQPTVEAIATEALAVIDAALASGEQGWRTDMATLPRDETILIAVERTNGEPMLRDRQRLSYPAYVDEDGRLCDAGTLRPDVGFGGPHFRTVAWMLVPAPPAPETRT